MDKLNYKLSKFLSKHNKITKKSSVGYLNSVMSSDDIKLVSQMIHEMIELPKYQPVLNQLKTTTGLINFVTGDGYPLLVECLLKAAFPLDRNSVFTMGGEEEITGSSFAIGSNHFGTIMDAQGQAVARANGSLEDILLGTDAMLTRDWLKEEKGMTDASIASMYGAYRDSTIQDWLRTREQARLNAEPGLPPPPDPPLPDEVRTSTAIAKKLGWYMSIYEYLEKHINDTVGSEISNIDRRIRGEPQADGTVATFNEEEIQGLKASKDYLIKQKRSEILNLRSEYFPTLGPPVRDRMSGSMAKNKDGFINYKPAEKIVSKSRSLIKLLEKYDPTQAAGPARAPNAGQPRQSPAKKPINIRIQELVMDLSQYLRDYPYVDERVSRLVRGLLDYMGTGTPENLANMKRNMYKITNQQSLLTQELFKQGRVLILDDFDKTVLCQQQQRDPPVLRSSARDLFSKFLSLNVAGIAKDSAPSIITYITKKDVEVRMGDEKRILDKNTICTKVSNDVYQIYRGYDSGKQFSLVNAKDAATSFDVSRSAARQEYGKKTVVLISSDPVGGLPAGKTVIELDTSRVNPEESEIIVRQYCDDLDKKKINNLKTRKLESIEDQHGDDAASIKRAKSQELLTPQEKESLTPTYIRKKMASYISGLNVRDAIAAIMNSLELCTDINEDDYLKPKISLDTTKLVKVLRDEVNHRIQTETLGATITNIDVKFDEYAYKRTSTWAKQVQIIGDVKTKLDTLSTAIRNSRLRIAEVNSILTSGKENGKDISDKYKGYLISERENCVLQAERDELDRSSLGANRIPHVFLLWGDPGVGKSIFAHALASLLDLTLVNIDITAQRDKWVGESGKNARRLLNMMESSKSTVFLMDEIDRQVPGGAGSQQQTHETTKEVTSYLLSFFEDTDHIKNFKSNEVFFVLTSNNQESIENALYKRTTPFRVELPEDPEDYVRFFKTYVNVEKARFPEYPWMQDPIVTEDIKRQTANLSPKERTKIINDKAWEYTFKVINSLNWDEISKEFAGRRIDFRTLKKILQEAYNQDSAWRTRLEIISSSPEPVKEIKTLRGLPLSNENLITAARYASSAERNNTNFDFGIPQIAMKKAEEAQKMMARYIEGLGGKPLPVVDYLLPVGEEELKKYPEQEANIRARYTRRTVIIPPDILEFMQKGAVSDVDENIPDTEGWEEQVDPNTGMVKTIKSPPKAKVPTPKEESEQLEEQILQEEDEETEENSPEKISSSTDYYFEFLKKRGVINSKNEIRKIKVKKAARALVNNDFQKQKTKADKGEFCCHNFVMISQGPEN